jgi:hypothetical protein
VSVPTPIGSVHYDEPRAVTVREPEGDGKHSAVHSGVNVYTDTLTEAQGVIAAWPLIMQAAADKADEILSALRAVPEPEPAASG